MKSDLQISDDSALRHNDQPTQLVNYGNSGVQIANSGTVNVILGSHNAYVCNTATPLCTEYYNLFVVGGEKFEGDRIGGEFTISKANVLVTEYTDSNIKQKFYNLRDNSVVSQILRLPSLFMDENADFKRSHPCQKALLGRVTNLEIKPNSIGISFSGNQLVFQQNITDLSQALGLFANPGRSELNKTHWAIKRVNLVDVLMHAGLIDARDI